MKKKIISAVCFLAITFFICLNVIVSENNSAGHLTLNILSQTASADIEIPIDWGDLECVCNDAVCQDRNWISFRSYCGTPSGGASNASCSLLSETCN